MCANVVRVSLYSHCLTVNGESDEAASVSQTIWKIRFIAPNVSEK